MKLRLIYIFFSIISLGLYGQNKERLFEAGVREHDLVRAQKFDFMKNSSIDSLLIPAETLVAADGTNVLFDIQVHPDGIYFLFENEKNNDFRVDQAGTWVIKRHLEENTFTQIKIFLSNNPGTYLLIYERDTEDDVPYKQVYLDFYLQGRAYRLNTSLASSLDSLITRPLSMVLDLSSSSIPWPKILPNKDDIAYTDLRNFLESLLVEMPLPYVDDGAMDSQGKWVKISTSLRGDIKYGVNCSGFAKWVIDRLYKKVVHDKNTPFIRISDLTVSHEELYKENSLWEAHRDRDPLFGLEWSRNLALTLGKASIGVNDIPYDYYDLKLGSPLQYRENIGYHVSELKVALYLASIQAPGNFYIGAVNSLFGRNPEIRQYHHIALFFPYFDKNGDFFIKVLESGEETSFEGFVARYKGQVLEHNPDLFVHLSRIEIPFIISFNN